MDEQYVRKTVCRRLGVDPDKVEVQQIDLDYGLAGNGAVVTVQDEHGALVGVAILEYSPDGNVGGDGLPAPRMHLSILVDGDYNHSQWEQVPVPSDSALDRLPTEVKEAIASMSPAELGEALWLARKLRAEQGN